MSAPEMWGWPRKGPEMAGQSGKKRRVIASNEIDLLIRRVCRGFADLP